VLVALLSHLPRDLATLWGLPDQHHYFSYHPDEVFLLLPSALYFPQGDWNPHFFNYGTLYIYLVGIWAMLTHAMDAARFPDNLRPLYEVGRNVTVWMGVATVALLYFVSWRKDKWLGPLAALLLALCPLHLVNSAYATVDVPATFFITLAFVIALYGAEKPNAKWGLLAGLAVGLAAATKYNMGLFIVPVILAPIIMPPRSWRWSWCLSIVGGSIVGFVIGCPYFYTDGFRRDVLFELHHARIGGTLAFVDTGNGWLYHIIHGLPVGLGYPLLLAVIIGIIAAIRHPSRPTRVALFWIVFYLFVIGFSKEHFIRYLVPLTPFLCLLAAAGMLWLLRLSLKAVPRVGAAAFGIAVIILTSVYVAPQVTLVTHMDPRDRAWAEAQPAASHRHVSRLMRVGLVEPPWYSDPPLSPYNGGPFSRRMFDEWNQRNGNRVVLTGWDAAKLEAEKPAMFFLSDLESQDLIRLKRPDALAFVAALDKLYEGRHMVARRESVPSWLAPPRSWAPPDWLYQSPIITMYYRPR
jgi:hypothetical protein